MEKKLKQIDRNNFYKNTFCIFKEINFGEFRKEDFKYHSKSGSLYHFTDEGVFRWSNHWGRVGNCRWKLETIDEKRIGRKSLGFAFWNDFFENDDSKSLFYIEKNEKGEYYSAHKDSQNIEPNWALFNAREAKKRLQIIVMVQEDLLWNKHLNLDNSTENQQRAIDLLRTTRKSWLEIKRVLSEN